MNNILKYSNTSNKMSGHYNELKNKNFIPKVDVNKKVKQKYDELQSHRHSNFSTKQNIKILALGDVSFTRDIEKHNIKYDKGRFLKPLSHVKEYLTDSDITICNLETLITNKGEPYSKKSPHIQFRSLPSSINALLDSGINLVNLANNHANDFFDEGLLDCVERLNDNGIDIIGINKNNNLIKIYQYNGLKVAFLGVTRDFSKLKDTKYINVYNLENKQKILNQIRALKRKTDLLIVYIHWGTEYSFDENENQRDIAQFFIDNGVNIIIGHHPHVIQNMEKLVSSKDKTQYGYVFYSLGNFLFDTHHKKSGVRNSLILKIDINLEKFGTNKNINDLISFEYLPCIIHPQKGFAPIPTQKNFTKFFPDLSSKSANNLYKYIDCAEKASCKEHFSNITTQDYFNKYVILLELFVLTVLCFIFIKYLK